MKSRDGLRTTTDRSGKRSPSVVGSTLGDASTRRRSRSLPKGGIRGQDGLKVAEGAMPESGFTGSGDKRGLVQRALRVIVVASGTLIVLLIVGAISMAILSHTDAFTIENIETFDTEHILAADVARLANIGERDTLLNLDENKIREAVMRNPWVGSVDIERVFPDTIRLRVNERMLGAVVAMSSGGKAWLLGNDNVWIEPLKLEVDESESSNDVALAQASSLGVILIANVPANVAPAAGCACTDGPIQAVMNIAAQLSDEFKNRIVCYSVSSEDDISCILDSGVEVSLGSDTNIPTKEMVAMRVLHDYEGQVTYINVRIPSRPTYRRVASEYVTEGTGATGTSVEKESIVPKVRALEEEEEKADSSDSSSDTATDSSGKNSRTEYGDTSGYGDYYDDAYEYDYEYGY